MSSRLTPTAGDGRVKLALTILALNLLSHQTTTWILGPLLVPIAAEFETTVGAVGLLAAVTSVPWAVAGLVGGPLSDRWGRKPMLLGGNLITGLGTVLAGFAGSYGALLAVRLLTGFGASTIGPNATSATADLVSPARRGAALGWVLSGSSLGSVVGVPVIAYIAGVWGWRAAFWAAGAVVLAIVVAESLILPVTGRTTGPGVPYLRSFRVALSDRSTRIVLIANLFERAAHGLVTVYLAAFLTQSYGLDLREVAPALAVAAIGLLVGSFLGGRLTDLVPKRTLAWATPLTKGLRILPLFLWTPGLLVTVALAFLVGILSGATRPVYMWLLTNVDPQIRGTAMGMTVISNQGGTILGASLGGLLLGTGTYAWLGWFGAATGIVAGLTATLMREPKMIEG